MAFYGYQGDVDNCYPTPYNDYTSFDLNPIQFSSSYDSPEYHFSATPLDLNYSAHTYTEPLIIHYNPIHYNYHESYANPVQYYQTPSPTKFRISYSVSEFNETDFDEYDPTPYGGGYDPVATYGKPLPPSDKICYPRSKPVALPDKQKDEIEIPLKPIDKKPDPESEVAVDIVPPTPTDETDASGNGADYSYGYAITERQMGGMPYGSGLESMDLCESLFGYWPCVSKRERDERLRQDCDRERIREEDPWNTAVDYLFGSTVVCGYEDYPQLLALDPQ